MNITSEMLVAVAGVVLSLLFSYIPGLRTWYAGLVSETKRLIMLGLLLVVTAAIFALGCYNLISIDIACNQDGLLKLVGLFVAGIVANQGTYLITPQTNDVVIAKQLRND